MHLLIYTQLFSAEKIAIAASYFSYVRKHCRYIALGDYGQLEETDVNDTLEFHPSNDSKSFTPPSCSFLLASYDL